MKTIATASKPSRLRMRQRRAHRMRIGRGLDRPVGEHALVDLDDLRIELLGLLDVAGENFRPRLVADLERVAKAARRDEQGALAAPLEQGVGRDRRAHFDDSDRARRNRVALMQAEKAADALDRGVLVGRALRQEFLRMQAARGVAADHVGEGSAAVDPEVPAAMRGYSHCATPWQASSSFETRLRRPSG